MRFVADNSVIVAWGLSEGDTYADAVLDHVVGAEVLVPSVWPLEFANALAVAERRGRLRPAVREAAPLATLDERLRAAAQRRGVALFAP